MTSLPKLSLPFRFSIKTSHVFMVCLMHSTCLVDYILLDFVVIFRESCKL